MIAPQLGQRRGRISALGVDERRLAKVTANVDAGWRDSEVRSRTGLRSQATWRPPDRSVREIAVPSAATRSLLLYFSIHPREPEFGPARSSSIGRRRGDRGHLYVMHGAPQLSHKC